jgi:DNA-binding transcriptional MocR family regulator
LHLRLEGVATDELGLRPDALRAACRRGRPRALYCMPAIHNPTAIVTPAARRREIAAIAATHGVVVIEDGIYAYLLDEPEAPIASLIPDAAFYVTSLSKSVAAGLRIGFLRAPPAYAAAASAAVMAAQITTSPLAADIAATLIEDGVAADIVAARRRQSRARQALARRLLGDYIAPSASPDSPHVWLHLPPPWRAAELVAGARARGVAVGSPELFAVGRDAAPHAVRLSLGAPAEDAALERALRVLASLLAGPPAAVSAV